MIAGSHQIARTFLPGYLYFTAGPYRSDVHPVTVVIRVRKAYDSMISGHEPVQDMILKSFTGFVCGGINRGKSVDFNLIALHHISFHFICLVLDFVKRE